MPNTSVIDISNEEGRQNSSRCDSIKFGRTRPTLSDRLNVILGLNGIVLQGASVQNRPHLGHMTRYGPKLQAKRQFGKEKS